MQQTRARLDLCLFCCCTSKGQAARTKDNNNNDEKKKERKKNIQVSALLISPFVLYFYIHRE